jgi:NAD-dependent deacetylase
MSIKPIPITDETMVLVLTGAGISAESGIPTFRDANGLWESHAVEEVASPEGWAKDPSLVWRFYGQRRAAAAVCAPNRAHVALAALERRLGDRFLLVTQNVDGLHRRAGSERIVEIHGALFQSRCDSCDRPPFSDDELYADGPRGCERCARGQIRPNIVWFGENLDVKNLERIEAFGARARGRHFVYVAVGTSGVVYPAAGIVSFAKGVGAETWLQNLEVPDNASAFDHFVEGPAGVVLPQLLGATAEVTS